jgi:hypothetical protein
MSILVLWFCAERFLIRENGARLALHKIGWWPVTRTHLQASARRMAVLENMGDPESMSDPANGAADYTSVDARREVLPIV